jgi:hypothetical protein
MLSVVMLNVANSPFILNVVMLSVHAPMATLIKATYMHLGPLL